MPTPGDEIGPFDNVITDVPGDVDDVIEWLGGFSKLDRIGAPSYGSSQRIVFAREHNRVVSAIGDLTEFARSVEEGALVGPQGQQRFVSRSGAHEPVARIVQHALEHREVLGLVVDDEDVDLRRRRGAQGRVGGVGVEGFHRLS